MSKQSSTLIIAVTENTTVMQSTAVALGLTTSQNYMSVSSYAEAIGTVAAHKAGVMLECLTPSVLPLREYEDVT